MLTSTRHTTLRQFFAGGEILVHYAMADKRGYRKQMVKENSLSKSNK
jgi:hypothetical protein